MYRLQQRKDGEKMSDIKTDIDWDYTLSSRLKVLKYCLLLTDTRKSQFQEAKQTISTMSELSEKEKEKLYRAFCHDFDRHRVSFSEYFYEYRFPELTESEKDEFISKWDYEAILKKYHCINPEQKKITGKKDVFLKEYKEFIHRKWLFVDKNTERERIQELLDSVDTIVKPRDSCGGKGVYKIKRGEGNAQDILDGHLPVMLEECIYNAPEIAAFHPASLNTARVTTISNGKEVLFLGACFRTGNNNSVCDNASSGGFLAEIDIETGRLISDGISKEGRTVAIHPISGKKFFGFQFPMWDEVKTTCIKAALQKKSFMIGWDIAVTPNGVEIIEANSVPNIFVGHQVPLHKGIKKHFYSQMDALHLEYRDVIRMVNLTNNWGCRTLFEVIRKH